MIHKEIKEIVKRNEIDFIDLKYYFEKSLEKKNTFFAEEGKGHLNEKGYNFVAESISLYE